MKKPIIGIAMGDPNGIGPEVFLKSINFLKNNKSSIPVLFGNKKYIARKIPKNINFQPVSIQNKHSAGALFAKAAILSAIKKSIHAVVTLPVNKSSFQKARLGNNIVGHTELIGKLSKEKNVALMMVHQSFRSIYVTSHLPFKNILRRIKKENIFRTIRLAQTGLKMLGVQNGRIGVSGLNPHNGDDGLLGNEEKRIILPAILKAKKMGIRVNGPVSPDAIWIDMVKKKTDVVVALYHDQGQIPQKLLSTIKSSSYGVNVTVGAKIIRTSPGHGTAPDIVGKNKASNKSFIEAYNLAVNIVRRNDKKNIF